MTGVREGLLGPSYFYHRHLISKSKGWAPSEIQEYQDKRFRRLILRYGDGITQREDYRRSQRYYTRWDVPPLTRTVRTGGTSGQPLRFTADRFSRRQKERAYLFDIWAQVGYAPYDLRVRYAGDIRGGRELLHYNWLENVWMVSPGATVDRQLGELRRWLRTLPPFFLHVYPSSLYTFIDLVGEELFRSLPVRGVIAASEMFPAGEQLRFEQEFGIKIAHWYGHSEYAMLAYCCRECRGFHFYPTYGYAELLPSETEGCRRVIASSYNRIGTQFVRYDTEDLAVDPVGSCAADNFPRVSAIVGRSQETFVDSSGRRRSLFGYAFGDLDHDAFYDQIRDMQFVQDKVGCLRLLIVTNPGADKGQIQRTFERHIPVASLEFEYVSAIERSPSGKRRYFVDGLHADAAGQK
jgi:phenylacetate-CoA ligase